MAGPFVVIDSLKDKNVGSLLRLGEAEDWLRDVDGKVYRGAAAQAAARRIPRDRVLTYGRAHRDGTSDVSVVCGPMRAQPGGNPTDPQAVPASDVALGRIEVRLRAALAAGDTHTAAALAEHLTRMETARG